MQRAGCSTEIDSNALMLSGAREGGCFREVAALHSDHLKSRLHDHLSALLSMIRLNALISGCIYTKHFEEVLFAF